MTKLSDSIIGKIKCEQIKPVPKWHFLMKKCTLWTMFFVSVVLGSLSFSVIMHIVNAGDLSFADHLHGNWFISAVMLLPVFWMIWLFIFAILAFLNWKCTKLGYCTKRRWLLLGSILASMFLGQIFYMLGLGRHIDNAMTLAAPFYDQYKHQTRSQMWMQPDRGFLIGKIIEIDEEMEKLLVKDEFGKNWIVDDLDIDWENEGLERKGKMIKIKGQKTSESEFEAKEIRRCINCQDDESIESVPEGVCFKPQEPGCTY